MLHATFFRPINRIFKILRTGIDRQMAIDMDLIAKLGALVIGAASTLKLANDWLTGQQGRIREEYKFARDFFADLERTPKMHPFVKEKGYHSIAGDTRLSVHEIQYLLMLTDSPRALRDYVLGRPYLQHIATAGESQISFHPRFTADWTRLWRKALYFSLYLLFFMGAFSPLLLPALKVLPSAQALTLFGVSVILFVPSGFLAIRAGVRISRAEALVKSQRKHTDGIQLVEEQ